MNPSVETPSSLLGESESVVVEAPTVEAALEAVATQMGTNAQIVGVEKVQRGGIAGFFGKETYQVEVQRPAGPSITPRHAEAELGSGGDQPTGNAAVDRVLAAAADVQAQRGPQTFGEMFRSEIGAPASPAQTPEFDGIDLTDDAPSPAPAPTFAPDRTTEDEQSAELTRLRQMVNEQQRPAPAAAPTTSAPTQVRATQPEVHNTSESELARQPEPRQASTRPSPATTPTPTPTGREPGEPLFTADHLVRSGLPFSFVVQLGDLAPLDDSARLMQLAAALQPWCGALPHHDSLIVGLRADRLGAALLVPTLGATDPLPSHGSAIWPCDPNDPATTAHLEHLRNGRRLHVVDASTATLGALQPGTIVSWTDPDIGFESLLFALERGLHLGFDASGSTPRRATALETAISIRSRLPVSGA